MVDASLEPNIGHVGAGMPRLSTWIKEPYAGLSHFTGAALSIVALIALLVTAQESTWHYIGFAIYGTCLFLVYLASGLVHSLHCSPETEDRLEKFDYAAIFALIAGTYTPLCLTTLRGPWGWTLLSIEWGLAILGIVAVIVTRRRPKKLTMTLYIVMGWLLVIAAGPVTRLLPPGGFTWLLAGGIVYSIGAVVFSLNRPVLWPGKFGAHDLWHTLVLAGSFCHFVVMLWFI